MAAPMTLRKHTIAKSQSLPFLMTRYYRLVLLFAACAGLYLAAVLATPNERSLLYQYDFDQDKAALITLMIYLPFVCVWFIALIGYMRLREYVRTIRDSVDGKPLVLVTRGVFWLTVRLPLSAVVTALTRAYYHVHPTLTAAMVQLNIYGNLVLLILTIAVTYYGSLQLLRSVRQSARMPLPLTLIYIAFAAVYAFLTFVDPVRQAPDRFTPVATYYLPDWAVMTTIVIPRLLCWYIALQAAYNIYMYQRHVEGAIYREALTSLSVGVAGVIILTMIFRSVQSVATLLIDVNLAVVLLVIYGILLILSAGYLLIARGASRLRQFEKS